MKKPKHSPATAPATPVVTPASTQPTSSSAPPSPTDIEPSMDIDGERLDLGGAGENLDASQQEMATSQKADKPSTSHSASNQDKAEATANDAAKNSQAPSTSIAGGATPSNTQNIYDTDDEDEKLAAKLMEIKAKLNAVNASKAELDALRETRNSITNCFNTLEREKLVSSHTPSSPRVLL